MTPSHQLPATPPTRKLLWKGASRLLLVMAALVVILAIVASLLMSKHDNELRPADRPDNGAEAHRTGDIPAHAMLRRP